jgi:hypothetical protein
VTAPTIRAQLSSEYSRDGRSASINACRHSNMIRPFSQLVVLTKWFQRPTNGCDASSEAALCAAAGAVGCWRSLTSVFVISILRIPFHLNRRLLIWEALLSVDDRV